MVRNAASWSMLLVSTLLFTACEPARVKPPPPPRLDPESRSYRGLPAGSDEGDPRSLLAQYSRRDPIEWGEAGRWPLPSKGKQVAVALLTTAALDRLEDLPRLLTSDAGWGLPHRAEYGARPVFSGDGGAEFFDVLRTAASRFKGLDPSSQIDGGGGGSAVYTCPPLVPGVQDVIQTGAEPYWCYYQSNDRLDLLVFKMRVIQGRTQVEYVGLFEERPSAPVVIPRHEAVPPLTPPIKMPVVQKVSDRMRPPAGGVAPRAQPRGPGPALAPGPP